MAGVMNIEDYWAAVVRRRKEIGMTEADDLAMINEGSRRTPEKRDLLRRIAERCREAGIEPRRVNY